MNNIFDKNRFTYLLLRQIQLNGKGLLLGAAVFIGFAIFINVIELIKNPYGISSAGLLSALLPIITIGGYIYTSTIFAELNSPQKSYLYLMLPASTEEKLAVAWLTSSVFYLALAISSLFIINVLLLIINQFGIHKSVSLVNLFNKDTLLIYANYMVTQSIFLLGAIYFRKNNFLKTILALIVTGFAIALFCGLLFTIYSYFHQGEFHGKFLNFDISNNDAIVGNISLIAKTLYWGFTAPFFIIVSYFSLKERQV